MQRLRFGNLSLLVSANNLVADLTLFKYSNSEDQMMPTCLHLARTPDIYKGLVIPIWTEIIEFWSKQVSIRTRPKCPT